jgi:hypothetical protein
MINMTQKGPRLTITNLIEAFRQSTIDYYSECENQNFKKQKILISHTNKIIDALDSLGAEGRFALIPLLDDTDQGIRVVAAAYLLKVIPERAIAVLKEIEKGPTIFPRLDAGDFLDSYANGKWRR